jgi:hypothetical protein
MPIYNRLTDRSKVSAITLNDIIHVVVTGDTSQSPQGSSYYAPLTYLQAILSGSSGTNGTSGTSPVVSGLNNEVLTSDGSGGIVAESNMTFDGTLLNITGRTDIYDTIGNIPSLNIFSQHNYPQHSSLLIDSEGTPTGNTKLYGAEITVYGASSSNTGIKIAAGGTDDGNNTGIDVSNNSTGSGSLQFGIIGSVLGSMTNGLGTKYGSNFQVTNSAQFNIGYSVQVSDATILNIGYEAFINGTTGNSIGMQVLNANADTNGGDSQIGVLIDVLGGGSFVSTNKKGLDINVIGDAQSNIGLRSSASGAIQNYAIYTSGGRFSFYHDPTIELTPTSVGGYGDIVTFGGVGSTFSPGDVVYLDINGDWLRTDATTATTSTSMLAIALGSVPSEGMLVRGYASNSSWGFTIGVPLYLRAVPGSITETAPGGTGEVVRIVGYATGDVGSGKKIYFNPNNTWVEL